MKKIIARLLCASMVAGLLFSINTPVLAAPPTEEDISIQPEQAKISSTINPYERVEAEDCANSNQYLVQSGIIGIYFRSAFLVYENVDFDEGSTGIDINMGAYARSTPTIKIRLDSQDGPVISSLDYTGKSAYEDVHFEFDSVVSGVHDLYFEISGNQYLVGMDYWIAAKAPVSVPVIDDPVIEDSLTLEYDVFCWGTGYKVDIKVINNTDEDVVGWKLRVKKDGRMLNESWCVNIEEDGDYYVITPLDWNSVVPAHDNVFFGITGVGQTSDIVEYTFEEPDPVATEKLAIDYNIQSWDTGYNVNFTLTNNSDQQLNGWTVKLDKNTCNIDSSWSVNVKESGDYYVITPMDWNKTLTNGQSAEFGFNGSGSVSNNIYVDVQ